LAKNLKLNIKNTQIAQAIDLGSLKNKLSKEKAQPEESAEPSESPAAKPAKAAKTAKHAKEESSLSIKDEAAPRIKARSKSAFSEPQSAQAKAKEKTKEAPSKDKASHLAESEEDKLEAADLPKQKTSEELRKTIFGDEIETLAKAPMAFDKLLAKPEPETKGTEITITPAALKEEPAPQVNKTEPAVKAEWPKVPQTQASDVPSQPTQPITPQVSTPKPTPPPTPIAPSQSIKPTQMHQPQAQPQQQFQQVQPRQPLGQQRQPFKPKPSQHPHFQNRPQYEKLGPTGRHVNDLIPRKPAPPAGQHAKADSSPGSAKPKPKPQEGAKTSSTENDFKKPAVKVAPRGVKEFRDVKPGRKTDNTRSFDNRDRQGLRTSEEDRGWRKRRPKQIRKEEDTTIRPTSLSIRIPITIKDLAAEMKLKASQLVAKLFMQGVVATLNDYLEDETTIQLLGHEFGCEITINTTEEERLRITDKNIKEEIAESPENDIVMRPPIVAFMGHVDHGKTSLIDYIRSSNRASGEAGAITQHIGAFRCKTAVGDIAILDTPGHEAFSAMRARGADVTDIVVLVIAGDEGIRQQTSEAIQHAKAANVTIVVAINKSDKPNFDPELVYRQLSEQNLLPEAWGGQTITVNCSAVTGEGVQSLLEMLALQAEVLELKANPSMRARGSVLESEMHKGMGAVATVLVQNGSLKLGDALVFGQTWGRVKTMHDEYRHDLKEAGPSTPIEITGLSGLPEAGEEFIVVKNEREARDIAEGRMQDIKQTNLQLKKKLSVENLFQQAADGSAKKILNVVLRADVQGSLEALKAALMKIESKKAELNIIFTGVGEISESDVQLAAASKAVVLGFHTQIESHADILVKQLGVQVRLHDIIYHAIDDIKLLLAGILDKIAVETEKGKAEVRATFKSSQHGIIAGCQAIEGTIIRKNPVRVRRGKEAIWKGTVSSLKRVKEDVSEVTKGLECGIVLNGFDSFEIGDIIESYEVTYITQEL